MGSRASLSRVQSAVASAASADVVRHDDARLAAAALAAPTGNPAIDTVTVNTAKASGARLPLGTYVVNPLTLAQDQPLRGSGLGTVIQLAPNSNTHLISTTDFSTLTGGGTTTSAPRGFEISDLTLDGNRANQTSGFGHGLAVFGYSYRIRNVVIRNARGWGLWSEWGTPGPFVLPDGMESSAIGLKIHSCAGGTLRYDGPHDMHFVDCIFYQGASGPTYATELHPKGTGVVLSSVHVYGGVCNYELLVNVAGSTLVGCQIEGGLLAQVYITSSNGLMSACKLFAGGVAEATARGIVMASGINSWKIHGRVENCGGGTIDLGTGGGSNDIDLSAYFYPGAGGVTPTSPAVAVSGGLDKNSSYKVLVHDPATGNLTGASLVRFGQARLIGGSTPTANGYTNGASAIVSGTDSAGIVTFTAAANPVDGVLGSVVFADGYTTAPNVILSPSNAAAAAAFGYVLGVGTWGFEVAARNAPPAGAQLAFSYQVA